MSSRVLKCSLPQCGRAPYWRRIASTSADSSSSRFRGRRRPRSSRWRAGSMGSACPDRRRRSGIRRDRCNSCAWSASARAPAAAPLCRSRRGSHIRVRGSSGHIRSGRSPNCRRRARRSFVREGRLVGDVHHLHFAHVGLAPGRRDGGDRAGSRDGATPEPGTRRSRNADLRGEFVVALHAGLEIVAPKPLRRL